MEKDSQKKMNDNTGMREKSNIYILNEEGDTQSHLDKSKSY